MKFFVLLSVKLATATVDTTSTMSTARAVFFDKFNIPKEGDLYIGESDFDFKQFLDDYNKMHETNETNENRDSLFARVFKDLTKKHQLPIQPGVETNRYNLNKMIMLLGMFLLLGSLLGRNIRSRMASLELVTREKYAAVIDYHEKYGEIIAYVPLFLHDAYYEETMLCWDKVRKSNGVVFWEFNECVTDPSNMMSEVLRFV